VAGDAGADTVPTIALFVTCVVDAVRPEVAVATVDLLRTAGAEVSCPAGQTCCGQPAWNAGFTEEAAAVAGTTLDALERDPAWRVVVPAGSCATMIRRYWPQLFALAGRPDDVERAERLGTRVVELSELLATLVRPDEHAGEPAPPSAHFAFHRSCHLERELHVVEQPVTLLTRATGSAPAPWPADDRCCGFGGTFSIRLPEASVAMADEKLDTLPVGVDTIVGCDTSCLLHLEARARERGLELRFRHLAEVVAEAVDPSSADG
jgi:L-lactate dehydrogenase complex protein LldE